MRKATFVLAALALGAGLTAAGCGGEDHLTKSEFLSQGNAICAKGNKEINAAAKKFFPKNTRPSNAEFQKFATQTIIPNVQGQIDGIDDLSPPTEEEDAVNELIDTAQADLDKAKADPTLLEGNGDPFADANKMAKEIGLNTCAG